VCILTTFIHSFIIHSFIPLTCSECDNSLLFSGAFAIPLCYILFPATFLHQLFFHRPSLHLTIYFLVCLLVFLIPNSYTMFFWELYFLPFSVHVQTKVIYLTLLSLLWWEFQVKLIYKETFWNGSELVYVMRCISDASMMVIQNFDSKIKGSFLKSS
jgi:hypothetical protein